METTLNHQHHKEKETMDSETTQEILHLYKNGMAKRAIARKLGCNVKTVRRILDKQGLGPAPQNHSDNGPRERPESKLTPYLDLIARKVRQGLTGARILREIGEKGYTGGRTILLDHLRKLRGPSRASRRTYRRFETTPAQEAQVDWSPYQVEIAGRTRTVHCFSMLLCYSRQLFIQFHREERLPTLLAAHVDAFHFFQGVARRIVYDNMTTVTLGRRGKEIIWNREFLEFAKHYMFEPRLCRPRDPNRKGKVENPFQYIEKDFLQARTFQSWEDLDRAAHAWLTQVANRRVHATTRLLPEEAWMSERDFLTGLPETPFPTYRPELRPVSDDGLVSVDGTRYSVPVHLVGNTRTVSIRVHPRVIEILNREGLLIATHRKPDLPGGLVLDDQHYDAIRRRPPRQPAETDRQFLRRFPNAEPFLKGLKPRMKGFYRLHLCQVLQLALHYGQDAVAQALERATHYGNFNAHAVRRILQDRFPLITPELTDDYPLPNNAPQCQFEDDETEAFEQYQPYSREPHSHHSDLDDSQHRKEEQ